MRLFVKNMMSIRCKLIVKSVLKNMGMHYMMVELGEIEIREELSAIRRSQLSTALLEYGLELMDDSNALLIERINSVIVEMIHYSDDIPLKKSVFISEKIGRNYADLAKLYSETTGTTIEHRIIHHKIERVKEMLVYGTLSLTEIAYQLHYSSVSHLSIQFKKVTGLTPTFFRNMKQQRHDASEENETSS